MTLNPSPGSPGPSTRRRAVSKVQRGKKYRHRDARLKLSFEPLEERALLALGPTLVGINPNTGSVLLHDQVNAPLHVAPTDLTFRFDDAQSIDKATLAAGISIVRSGGAGDAFGAGGSKADVTVNAGALIVGESTNEVIFRFADALPDDDYRIVVSPALKNVGGDLFDNNRLTAGNQTSTTFFRLDLGPKVTAVVPQPVTRDPGTGALSQARNQIQVFFSNDPLDVTSAQNLAFYQLSLTKDTATNQDDAVVNPTTAIYDQSRNLVTLTFGKDQNNNPITDLASIGVGAMRLRIGTSEATPAVPNSSTPGADPGDSFATAQNLGSVLNTQSQIISSSIDAQFFPLDLPGANDEPGDRDLNITNEQHVPDDSADASTGIETVAYNFQLDYGANPEGIHPANAITEAQKNLARDVFQLLGTYYGVQFVETAHSGITVVTGDVRVADPTATAPGIGGGSLAIMNANQQWSDAYGGDWFDVAMHEIDHCLGLVHAFELPSGTVQGPYVPGTQPLGAEGVFPGDADIISGQYLHRPEGTDIDLYKFTVASDGVFSAETIAERQTNSSLLNTALRVYQENPDGTRTLLGQNDDYFSNDSFLQLNLTAGTTYYVGVSASGNTSYDPSISGSGFGGTTQGNYALRLDFRPRANNFLVDATGTAFDGDADGVPGGVDNFWFRSQTIANTIYVDKATTGVAGPLGSITHPYKNIDQALLSPVVIAAAASPGEGAIVRIEGNQADGSSPNSLPYEIGTKAVAPFGALGDGSSLLVPKNTTVMIDAGAALKLLNARIAVGSSSAAVDRSGGALQVLGTPESSVYFTSENDSTVAKVTSGSAAAAGDWGGILFQGNLDEAANRFSFEDKGIFLNYVNHADLRFGGGSVDVDGGSRTVTPIDMLNFRPTISFNRISNSQNAAVAANPDSFEETNFHTALYQGPGAYTPDYSRVGPEVHDNALANNSLNGMLIRVSAFANSTPEKLTVTGRFDDTDIVHIISQTLQINGTPGGPITDDASRPPVSLVALSEFNQTGGTLVAGNTYKYVVTFVDSLGNEGPLSLNSDTGTQFTSTLTLSGGNNAIELDNLPVASAPFVARKLYRSTNGGAPTLVKQLDATSTTYIDDGTTVGGAVGATLVPNRARLDGSLVIDPGVVVKSSGARIEAMMGANLLAEGVDGKPVVFTSTRDDRYGAGGTFDTNNDGLSTIPVPAGTTNLPIAGGWGGLVASPTSTLSLDHAVVAYGGGVVGVGGSSAGFNAVEVYQATARITNSVFEFNGDGQKANQGNRFGYQPNAPAVIWVLGAQPVIVNNQFRHNNKTALNQTGASTAAISINVNALNSIFVADPGRSTGAAGRFTTLGDNQGPLVRLNRLDDNATNGMVVRGATLTTQSVWDDTDIVHVLLSSVTVPDFHVYGGLRLQSSATGSLVVKLFGASAFLTATGQPLEIDDRIGGSMQILGQPGFPVVLTSLRDDTVGAGFRRDGTLQGDTNNDGGLTVPKAGDWRSIRIDTFANDRNVDNTVETEVPTLPAAGVNGTINNGQVLGNLATDETAGDENQRLGFEVHGFLSSPSDVDVYNFSAVAGTEVWFDVDRTTMALDSMLELVDASGNVYAASDNSFAEHNTPALRALLIPDPNNPGQFLPNAALDMQKTPPFQGQDFYGTNPLDPGMRVVLPGDPAAGATTYHVRIRSAPPAGTAAGDLTKGQTSGEYQLQIRLREVDEIPGSTVRFANVSYATNGIEVFGQPTHSPLLGESAELIVNGNDNNNTGPVPGNAGTAQDLGNLHGTDRGAISVAGNLSSSSDIDWYTFTINTQDIELGDGFFGTAFDIDYGDSALSRPDTSLAVFQANRDGSYSLIYISEDAKRPWDNTTDPNSNVSDDRPGPLTGNNFDDLLRGSSGGLDAYIGSVGLAGKNVGTATGQYFVAVTSDGLRPSIISTNSQVRLQPISSLQRIAEDNIGGVPGVISKSGPLVSGAVNGGAPFDNPVIPALFGTDTGDTDDAGRPIIDASIDPGSTSSYATPFNLGDVVLFVSGDVLNTPLGTSLLTVDPFTGALETVVGSFASDVGDITLRRDTGGLFAFSTDQDTGGTDAGAGNFLKIDTGNAAATNLGSDGLLTYQIDPSDASNVPPNAQQTNRGIQLDAVSFVGDNASKLFGVGHRGDAPFGANGNDYATNILYAFNVANGAAFSPTGLPSRSISTTAADPPGMAYDGAGTTIHEVGQILDGGSPLEGNVTGMANVGNFTYLVTDEGVLYRTAIGGKSATELRDFGATGFAGISFGALTNGPTHVEPDPVTGIGRFASTLFGVSDEGQLLAFNTSGASLGIFVDGANSVELTLPANVTEVHGLAFSNLDMNLWHVTTSHPDTGADTQLGQATGLVNPVITPNISSLHFGYENALLNYGRNAVAGDPTNTNINPYDFPGGAYGSIVSNPFSLEGYSADDQPTMYFDFFADLGTNDTFQVFISGDDVSISSNTDPTTIKLSDNPSQWTLLGTMSSSGGDWKQQRIPLTNFAGQTNLRLRFDFSTAGGTKSINGVSTMVGDMNTGDTDTTGDELRALPAAEIADGKTFTITTVGGPSKTFEFDLGPSILAVPGARIKNGDAFTVKDPGGTSHPFTFVLNGTTGGTTIGYSNTDTAAQIAAKISAAVGTPNGLVTSVSNFPTIADRVNFSGTGVTLTTAFLAGSGLTKQETTGGSNVKVLINAGMSADEVATAIQSALQTTYGGTFYRYNDVVRVIGHDVTLPGTFDAIALANTLPTNISGNATSNPVGYNSNVRGQDNVHEGVYLDHIIIGFAERGEKVLGATNNSDFTANFGTVTPKTQILDGNYQLEIRNSADYSTIKNGKEVTTRSFDTNDRLATNVTLTAPAGEDIVDGQTFNLSDGINQVVFEFNDLNAPGSPAVAAGHQGVNFRIGMPAFQVARAIRDAINSSAVQNVLHITAAIDDGKSTGSVSTGDRVNLFGPVALSSTDLPINVSIAEGAAGNDTLATALDTGITPANRTNFSGNGNIGDNINLVTPAIDVDMLKVQLNAGDTIHININARTLGSGLDSIIRVFSSGGTELDFNDDDPAPGEPSTFDSYLDFVAPSTGTFFIGVSSFSNFGYNPNLAGSGSGASTTGSYTIEITFDNANFFAASAEVGDQNRFRDQGQIIISQNRVFDSLQYGIVTDASARVGAGAVPHPGSVRNLPELDNQNWVPGPVIVNNLIVRGGLGGIHISGDNGAGPAAAVPVDRVINNTIYGTGLGADVGILVDNNASPTLLNNIVSNLGTGIQIADAGSSTTEIHATLYDNNNVFDWNQLGVKGKGVNALAGDEAIFVPVSAPLFLRPGAPFDNYYLDPNALAIDTALDTLDDRSDLVRVKSAIGLPVSTVIAPERDLTGEKRVDVPGLGGTGSGTNPFKDRGAIDRADFTGPTAILLNPFDNDDAGVDKNAATSIVRLVNGSVLTNFAVQLVDGFNPTNPLEGTGIDNTTIVPDVVSLTFNGLPQTLGVNYTFSYDSTNHIMRLIPLTGIWLDGLYTLTLDNGNPFVIYPLTGAQVLDGQTFTLTDNASPTKNTVVFEYDNGFNLTIPAAGGGAGGITDGQQFTIAKGAVSKTFEFDDGTGPALGAGIVGITFVSGATPTSASVIADRVVTAISGQATLSLNGAAAPVNVGGGRVVIGGVAGQHTLVAGPAGPPATFTISGKPGLNAVGSTNTRVPVTGGMTAAQMATALRTAINGSAALSGVTATIVAGNKVQVTGISGSFGISGGIQDLAGNNLTANQTNGTTSFTIQVADIFDFGDAPDTYSTLLASNGPRHLILPGSATLGATRDNESDGQPTATANGDDTIATDDEDGLVSQTSLPAGGSGSVTVDVENVTGTYRLSAWVDFDRNGVFDSGEQVATDVPVTTSGNQVLNFSIPSSAPVGNAVARFRLSTASGLSFKDLPGAFAPDGEVEDHLLAIVRQTDLQVAVTDAPDPVTAGSGANNLVYTATVKNDGPSDASGVSVNLSNVLPAGVVFVSATGTGSNNFDGAGTDTWTIGTLPKGSTATLAVTYTVGASTLNGATVSLTVNGATDNETLILTSDDADTEVTTVQRQVDLQVSVTDLPDPVIAGSGAGNLVYTATVHNNGPSDSSGVTLNLSNLLPTGVTFVSATGTGSNNFDGVGTDTWTIGNLAKGSDATLTVTYTVGASTANAATVSLTVDGAVSSDPLVAPLIDDADTESTTVQRQVDLQVAVSDAPDPVTAGSGAGNLVYTATVHNAGPSDASGITLNVSNGLPVGVTFVSATGTGSNNFDGVGTDTWTIGGLASGATATLTVTYTVGASTANGAVVSLTANGATASETLTNTGDDADTESTTVQRRVDLQVGVTDVPDPVTAGSGAGNLVYTATVHNAGPSDASGVTLNLSNVLPAGVSFVSATGTGSNNFDGVGTDTWTIGGLASGATATLTVTYTVGASTANGVIVNLTVNNLTAAETLVNTGDDAASESTTVQRRVDLQVGVSDLPDPVIAGSGLSNLVYTATVHNAGPSNASGVSVKLSNILPPGVSFESANGTGNNNFDGLGTDTWTIGLLNAGATATLTVTYTVGASTADGVLVSLTANGAAATETLITTGDDADTETTTVLRQVNLQVDVTDAPDPVTAGSGTSNLVYTATVRNAGPSNASGVSLKLSDVLPAGVNFVSATGAGSNDFDGVGTDTWTIGALNSGASAQLTVKYTVGASTAASGAFVTLTVDGAAANETLVTTFDDADTETTTVTRLVDIDVSETESTDPVIAGSGNGNLVYVVTALNHGPSDASGVKIGENLTIPSGVTIVSITPSAGTFAPLNDPHGTWDLGTLSSLGSATLTITLTVGAAAPPGTNNVSSVATVTAVNEVQSSTLNDSASQATSIVILDFGDAPATFPTLLANNGARHAATGATLGATRDIEIDGQPSALANGDDTNGSDDEDGLVSQSVLAAGGVGSVTVNVQNTTPGYKLSAWIDFNEDGDWNDAGEQVADDVSVADGNKVLNFNVPAGAVVGNAVARFRLSTDSVHLATGLVSNGEVEDHLLSIVRQTDLIVSQTESVDPVVAGSGGGNLTYVVNVHNNGPTSASGLELAEVLTLPAGASVVSITPNTGTYSPSNGPVGTWTVGNLANGVDAKLTIVLNVGASTAVGTDTISSTATVTASNETRINTGDDTITTSTSVARLVDLVVTETESASTVVSGGGTNLTYVVKVANSGPSDASGVSLGEVLTLPTGASVVSITPSAGAYSPPNGLTGTWTVGNLAGGANATLTIVVSVGPATAAGINTIRSTATVSSVIESQSLTSNDSATQSTSVEVRPTAVIGGAASVGEGLSIVLDGSGSSDPNATITTFQWDLNFTGTFNPTATGSSVNFSAANLDGPSTRVVALRVTNSLGVQSSLETKTISILNRDPSITSFSVPASGFNGQPVSLVATATDPAGLFDPLTFTWTITRPDSSTFTRLGANANFTLDAVGLFGVSLTVEDGDGGSDTRTTVIDGSLSPGNVTTQIVIPNPSKPQSRQLIITGDDQSNQIELDLGAGGSANTLRLSGLNGTTIDGQTNFVSFSDLSLGIVVRLLDGNDLVYLNDVPVNGKTTVKGPITLDGGLGDDTYIVSATKTKLTVNDAGGHDTFDFSVATKGVTIDLSKSIGKSQSLGNGNSLKLTGQIEDLIGSRFNDSLKGNAADNLILGGQGNDKLNGGDGNDILRGGDGNDTLTDISGVNALLGEGGNDKLTGGTGNKKLPGVVDFDLLIGGLGSDTLTAGKQGNSILIGGTTSHDDDDGALLAILDEWSSGAPLSFRIADLQNGVGPGNSIKLTTTVPATVVDDVILDTLKSVFGNNWIFQATGDKVTGKKPTDVVQS